MRRKRIAVVAAGLLLLLPAARPASADWDPGDPYKWRQLPDSSEYGVDVDATIHPGIPGGRILADDFLCTETGYVTGIHIWGSWHGDYLPFGDDPRAVRFTLSFHADIPDSESPTGYSMPGDTLWVRTFEPGDFTARVYWSGIDEGWFDPPDFYEYPADSVCWQYNFYIDTTYAFHQQGTPTEPVTYWLDMQAETTDEGAFFGWKTSLEHWNDDAVWGVGREPFFGPWYDLRYPPEHEMHDQSMDLAFVIERWEEAVDLDYGDAPDNPLIPGYPTLLVNNGARHTPGGPWLGDATDAPDPEPDGQPNPGATGDDMDGNDDEDGVQLPLFRQGKYSTITLDVTGGGYVEGWIDFNADQTWQHPGERIFNSWLAAGTHTFDIATPYGATLGQTFSRWRISSTGGLPPQGAATDGEVEDYRVTIDIGDPYKWLQPPDLRSTGIDVNATELMILADDFECTEEGPIIEIIVWGSWKDDYLPFGNDPRAVDFTLSIHDDIPDSLSGTGYSVPGNTLWVKKFDVSDFQVKAWRRGIDEGWFHPPDDGSYYTPADTVCWWYKFFIETDSAFVQEGTPEEPIVYWLDVQAEPHDSEARFGWKTSRSHWNDCAVWGIGNEIYPGPWYRLLYPPGHEWEGDSLDMAFLIGGVDWADVPERDHLPSGFGLHQNIPNPFRPATEIQFEIPAGGRVTLEIYDVRGRLVRSLVDEALREGLHTSTWSGLDDRGVQSPPGVYFSRLRMGELEDTRKMLRLR